MCGDNEKRNTRLTDWYERKDVVRRGTGGFDWFYCRVSGLLEHVQNITKKPTLTSKAGHRVCLY
jgi:hypothetical protein